MRIDEVIQQMRVENYKFVDKIDLAYKDEMLRFINRFKENVYELVASKFSGVSRERLDGFVDEYFTNEIMGNHKGENNQLGYRLDEAIRSFERMNENLSDTTRAMSALKMLINEQQRNINFDREVEIGQEFANLLARNLLNNSNGSRYVEDAVEEIRTTIRNLSTRGLDEVFGEYAEYFKRENIKLIDKYDELVQEYSKANNVKYEAGIREVSSTEIYEYVDSLGKMGYSVITEDNKAYVVNNNKEKLELIIKNGIITTPDSRLVLKEVKPGIYGVYDAENDVMCTIGDPSKGAIKYFHTQNNRTVVLEDVFLEYNIMIDGVRGVGQEGMVELLKVFERDFPSVYRRLYDDDMIFKMQVDQAKSKQQTVTQTVEEKTKPDRTPVSELLKELDELNGEDELELPLGEEQEKTKGDYSVGMVGLDIEKEIELLEQDEAVQRYLYLIGIRDIQKISEQADEITATKANRFL